MKTRAAILVEAGKPMVIDEVELPPPGPTQVLMRQFASGVCHSQLHVLNNPAPPVPMIIGHESTGEVLELGYVGLLEALHEPGHCVVGD